MAHSQVYRHGEDEDKETKGEHGHSTGSFNHVLPHKLQSLSYYLNASVHTGSHDMSHASDPSSHSPCTSIACQGERVSAVVPHLEPGTSGLFEWARVSVFVIYLLQYAVCP